MRKYIFLMVSILSLVSCKWHHDFCYRCGEHLDCCKCYHYYNEPSNDVLVASTLIGVWQTSYNAAYERGIGFTPKEFRFVSNFYCDITYSVGNSTTWYTETFKYSYSGGYIRFSNGVKTFSFKINRFLYPTLTLVDSHGTYEWYKRY